MIALTRHLTVALVLLCLAVPSALASPTAVSPDAEYDVAFSPNGGAEDMIISAIGKARVSVRVAAYSFTSKPVALALLCAHKRGLDVQVVADYDANSGRYTSVRFLANNGVPVRLNDRYAIHHNKFMVIDGLHVQTGSYNYSAAAQDRNAENVLMLWNVPGIARRYADEWQKLWDRAEILSPAY